MNARSQKSILAKQVGWFNGTVLRLAVNGELLELSGDVIKAPRMTREQVWSLLRAYEARLNRFDLYPRVVHELLRDAYEISQFNQLKLEILQQPDATYEFRERTPRTRRRRSPVRDLEQLSLF